MKWMLSRVQLTSCCPIFTPSIQYSEPSLSRVICMTLPLEKAAYSRPLTYFHFQFELLRCLNSVHDDLHFTLVVSDAGDCEFYTFVVL